MPSSSLFSTVPEDKLSLYKPENLPKVLDYLGFKKCDVAKATGTALSSIRYDDRMPPKISLHLREWAVILNLVAGHFKGDEYKTRLWFTIQNPGLGDMSPRDMIRFGRCEKLRKFVLNALSENK